MVLNAPVMPNIFNRSEQIGEGLGRKGMQKILDDMGLGYNMITQIHATWGSTLSTAEIEIDSHTFTKDDFEAGDSIFVVIEVAGATDDVLHLFATDSAGTTGTADIRSGTTQRIEFSISQDPADSSNLIFRGWNNNGSGVMGVMVSSLNMTDDDILTTAWKLSLRGNIVTPGHTYYWKWWIYRKGVGFEGEKTNA